MSKVTEVEHPDPFTWTWRTCGERFRLAQGKLEIYEIDRRTEEPGVWASVGGATLLPVCVGHLLHHLTEAAGLSSLGPDRTATIAGVA